MSVSVARCADLSAPMLILVKSEHVLIYALIMQNF